MNTAEAEGGGDVGSWYAQDATVYSLTLQLGAALDAAEGLRELVEIAEQHAERVDRMSSGDLADQGLVAAGIPPQLRASLDALMAEVEAEQSEIARDLGADERDAAAFDRDTPVRPSRVRSAGQGRADYDSALLESSRVESSQAGLWRCGGACRT